MKTIHPGHLEHRFCIFGCQILCIPDLAIMPQVAELASDALFLSVEFAVVVEVVVVVSGGGGFNVVIGVDVVVR